MYICGSGKENVADRDFPYILALCHWDEPASAALNSRLFKPSQDTDCHEPIHRIVAEYCAAQYLARRISDLSDPLSTRRSFALIAPNGVVRDELRGLLGWLAALGDASLQKSVIELDPYAVIANGDPAQLASQSKRLLLQRLKALAASDPYFRRADVWRPFNASGFFTLDTVDEIKLLIGSPSDSSHLLHLILELLQGEEAVDKLVPELRGLMLDPVQGLTARLFARRLAFEGQTDRNQIWETICLYRWSELHAGLGFTEGDGKALADYGFQTDNVALWSSFTYPHDRYTTTKGPDQFRASLASILKAMPTELIGFIDVYVLDLSKQKH
ncbi:hypothetical protein HYPDE_33343 [Hyphomicrobium denitrificans 1NES1]|uniref:Uncharacterized protein n=2 Tax=Hyphomicrobium denitrificans TaxID=53399 RepID=N0BCS8_9HYPH|nr:hypothetical protein HYPDE_33343 [Hyphomicrobium denitrificans 1NES1]